MLRLQMLQLWVALEDFHSSITALDQGQHCRGPMEHPFLQMCLTEVVAAAGGMQAQQSQQWQEVMVGFMEDQEEAAVDHMDLIQAQVAMEHRALLWLQPTFKHEIRYC